MIDYKELIRQSIDEAVEQKMDFDGNVVDLEPYQRVIKTDDKKMEAIGQYYGDTSVKYITDPMRTKIKGMFFDIAKDLQIDGDVQFNEINVTDDDITEMMELFDAED